MGDRAVVVFHSSGYYSPGVYMHWAGSEVPRLLVAAKPVLRAGDPSYAAARFCGVVHMDSPDSRTGLGLLDAPKLEQLQSGQYSHGDAGVFVVDVDTGDVQQFNGYAPHDGPELKWKSPKTDATLLNPRTASLGVLEG